MAYGQQAALRTQTTVIHVGNSWVALEAATPLTNRFAVKVFAQGTGGSTRLALSYDNSVQLSDASHWLSSGQFRVEPAATGLTLYGRAKLASGINSIRCVVVEYGH